MTTVALVLASVALAVSLVAAVLAAVVMRQNADTTTDLREHRRAHNAAFGHPDPKLDRRQVNLGPPRAGERRGTRYQPPADRLAPRPELIELDEQLTRERAEQIRDDLATAELDRTDLPTTQLEAQRPDVPDVRDLRSRP